MSKTKELLKTRNLTKNFGGVSAVRNVNFALSEGELRAIIGPNGAGKTTLVSLINGRLKASEGQIYFRGEEITGLGPSTISHKGVGSTFQQSNLFPNLTVFESIRLAVQSRDKKHSNPFKDVQTISSLTDKTEQILDLLGIHDTSDCPAASLSHGDQRLLEIGVALGTEPELLILDEPTAGMSMKETIEMGEVIAFLAKSKTILLIEHDVDLVMKLADSITVLDKGSILVEGPPEKIGTSKKVQEIYLGVS